MTRKTFFFALIAAVSLILATQGLPALAQEEAPKQKGAEKEGVSDAFRSTAYPIPRFVSLRTNEIYVRTGPGTQYPVQWIYKKAGLPVEITLEFENWRKLRDFEGAEGWVHHSMLSGQRMGQIQAKEPVPVYRSRGTQTKLAMAEPGVIVTLEECGAEQCEIKVQGLQAWIDRNYIWGIYENENFD